MTAILTVNRLTVPSTQAAARTHLDALAATLTGVQRHDEVIPGTRFFDSCERRSVAEHETLLAIKTQPTRHTSGRLLASFFVTDGLIVFVRRARPRYFRQACHPRGMYPFVTRASGSRVSRFRTCETATITVSADTSIDKLQARLPRVTSVLTEATLTQIRHYWRERAGGRHGNKWRGDIDR